MRRLLKVAGVVLCSVLPFSATDNAQLSCKKYVAFAYAESGQVRSIVPEFAQKWIKKNGSKHPSICFSQSPVQGVPNYLFVFSLSSAAFNGLYPTVKTTTATDRTPIYGSGTITNSYGFTWQYTLNGTLTTTTTTTEHFNLPYTDTTENLYLFGYDQNGMLIARRKRSRTTREGGDGMNTLGYNLGSFLMSHHAPEKLLADVVRDVEAVRDSGTSSPSPVSETAVVMVMDSPNGPVVTAFTQEPSCRGLRPTLPYVDDGLLPTWYLTFGGTEGDFILGRASEQGASKEHVALGTNLSKAIKLACDVIYGRTANVDWESHPTP